VAYRNQGLQFRPVEVNLDESVSLRSLIQLAFRAFVASILLWFVFAIFALLVLLAGSEDGPALVMTIGALLSTLLFWAVLLFSQMEEPISEWRTLIEDKSRAASSAYAVIYGSLSRRRIPVNSAAMRIRTDILSQEIVNNRLTISDREYVAYVSVFEYGTSLYVGWTMFRARRGTVLIARFLKDVLGGFLGRTGLIVQMLRTERARAMREAVHSAVREGVEVAIEGIEVPIAATFGHDVEIQAMEGGSGAMAPSSGNGRSGSGQPEWPTTFGPTGPSGPSGPPAPAPAPSSSASSSAPAGPAPSAAPPPAPPSES
jgi:hypothetical protein